MKFSKLPKLNQIRFMEVWKLGYEYHKFAISQGSGSSSLPNPFTGRLSLSTLRCRFTALMNLSGDRPIAIRRSIDLVVSCGPSEGTVCPINRPTPTMRLIVPHASSRRPRQPSRVRVRSQAGWQGDNCQAIWRGDAGDYAGEFFFINLVQMI